jgi:hypothetical protein
VIPLIEAAVRDHAREPATLRAAMMCIRNLAAYSDNEAPLMALVPHIMGGCPGLLRVPALPGSVVAVMRTH